MDKRHPVASRARWRLSRRCVVSRCDCMRAARPTGACFSPRPHDRYYRAHLKRPAIMPSNRTMMTRGAQPHSEALRSRFATRCSRNGHCGVACREVLVESGSTHLTVAALAAAFARAVVLAAGRVPRPPMTGVWPRSCCHPVCVSISGSQTASVRP